MSMSLTRRETEVLNLLLQGYMQKEVADLLNISLKHVQAVKSAIKKKWGVTTEMEFLLAAIREGYLDQERDILHTFMAYTATATTPHRIIYGYIPSKNSKVKVIFE